MAKQVTRSTVKMGPKLGGAFNKAKTNEVDYGNAGDLPGTIEMGVAQLTECKFGQYGKGDNKGEWFFYAAGTVLSPLDADVTDDDGNVTGRMRVKGLSTKIGPIPLCDTKNRNGEVTEAQVYVDKVINEFKKLGVETEEIDFEEEGALESVAATLKETKPVFRFRTWKGKKSVEYPNPRVVHEWKGLTEFVSEDGEGDGVEDGTVIVEEAEPAKKTAVSKTATPPKVSGKKAAKPAPEPEPEAEEEVDLDALVEAAKGDGDEAEAAATELHLLAMESGITEEDFANADWDEVASLIRIGEDPSEEGGEEEEAEAEAETSDGEEWEPEVEQLYGYAAIDPKTKKKGKLAEYEVIAVQKAAKTIHLKSNVTKKVLIDPKTKKPLAVKWNELETAPE